MAVNRRNKVQVVQPSLVVWYKYGQFRRNRFCNRFWRAVPNVWTVNSNDTFEKFTENPTVSEADLKLWQNNKTGVFANSIANNVGWVRFPNDSSVLSNQEDPAAGPHTAHFELLISNGLSIPPFPTAGNFLSITTVLLTPTSRGSVTINSSDPFAAPLIDPNMLSTEFDVAGLIESIRSVRRFVSAPAWDGYIATSVTNATTDAELEAFVRSTTSTLFHPVGTAAMSAKDAGYGVVDPDLRVKGVDGLRIVDASVLPFLPAAHTQAAVYVFAERASDLIKVFWKI
ncbi:hypothetical protein D9613_007239 [Agrocybe pediades]|uniref:Glucose-methanol-choline oxidoreductase C-terminal domain-containing protein n=1 Tax=Agrocybe pediades TaxID=84607 RepID=A0A8H4VIK2_9AGAR|nr:hypothetical protein D9613_007239 [Agrocybe pediades]